MAYIYLSVVMIYVKIIICNIYKMQLIHSTDDNNIYKILKDGKMRSSSKTKNVRIYGIEKGSKYIFLRLKTQNNIHDNLCFDINLLLDNVFYLHVGWTGEIRKNDIKIDGRKLDIKQLELLLTDFKNKINDYIKKHNNEPLIMSNEILVKNNISLKYLKKIKLISKNNKIIKYIEQNYPNVKIKIFNSEK